MLLGACHGLAAGNVIGMRRSLDGHLIERSLLHACILIHWSMSGYLCQEQLCSAILASLLDTSVCEQVMALDSCCCH